MLLQGWKQKTLAKNNVAGSTLVFRGRAEDLQFIVFSNLFLVLPMFSAPKARALGKPSVFAKVETKTLAIKNVVGSTLVFKGRAEDLQRIVWIFFIGFTNVLAREDGYCP